MKTKLEENNGDNRIINDANSNNFLNGNDGGNGKGRRNKKRLPIERPCYRCKKIIKLFFYPMKTNHIYCAVCEQQMNKEFAAKRQAKWGSKKKNDYDRAIEKSSSEKFKKIMFVRNLDY